MKFYEALTLKLNFSNDIYVERIINSFAEEDPHLNVPRLMQPIVPPIGRKPYTLSAAILQEIDKENFNR